MNLADIRRFFDQLNHDYLAVHRSKEDKFWGNYMATDTDDAGFVAAEQAWNAFLSDAKRLAAVREHLGALESAEGPASEKAALTRGLQGWRAFFESHIVESPEAQAAWDQILTLEADLAARRRDWQPSHTNAEGKTEKAALGVLLMALSSNPDEAGRKSSFEGLRAVEAWVLENGLLAIVRARNAFARLQGFSDYFEYKVRKTEKMTSDQLFAVLDEFEALTRDAQKRSLAELEARGGPAAGLPWNQRFYASGDSTRALDPYFPFSRAVSVWTESFGRLGIGYRGARLTLDLLERRGKHENGFCHAPVPSFFDGGRWVPAVVNFTSNAEPRQVGSGYKALETLFHEGGHAAHFANVLENSPCFSQEFAPTSMAYAETQSMFLDSLTRDADWLVRYGKTTAGEPLPAALVRPTVESRQPFVVTKARSLLVLPVFERALYRLTDAELTADRVVALARSVEVQVLGAESPRPTLAVPHLLNQESAASYQGYLLAEMAVAQTRAWFVKNFGFITDNPAVGPLLAEHYWARGNAVTHDQTLGALMGEGFSAQALAADCNRTPAQAWAEAEEAIALSQVRGPSSRKAASLQAEIRIVDGSQVLADNREGDAALAATFEAWLQARLVSESGA
jgi:Zn-dependent oligopeptidase